MATHQIKIRIVAAVDSSLTGVFNSMAAAAKRAGKRIGDDLGAGATIGAGPYRSMAPKITTELAKTERAAKSMRGVMGEVADGAKQKFQQLESELHKMPASLQAVSRAAQSELAKIERAQAKAQLGIGGNATWNALTKHRYRESMPGAMLFGAASRVGMGALGMGERVLADMLHGVGVNTDMGSMFSEAQKNQTLFRNISSFGYMPNTEGGNAERVDPSELLHEAHKIGQRTGFSAGEVGEGLEKFVGLTGDLKLGRESMEHMAVLSKATGSNLAEMVEAAGAASNSLGDMPNKAEVLYTVMKQVSSEGKTGAILIKDMAVQMAKIASASQMYAGDRVHTVSILGAMAQEARGRGGAASATQAATSVSQFTNVFKKRQRLDTFTGFGIKAYDPGGGIRDPQELIVESFLAAMKGGNRLTPAGKKIHMAGASGVADKAKGWQNFETNLTALYGDVKAMRATAGFEDKFKTGYTGKSGSEQEKLAAAAAAVNEEFHRLTVDMMDEKTVQDDFQLAMQNSKSKVAVFNDQIQEIAEDFQKQLLPAVVTLGPEMVLLAKGASHLVQILLGINPPPPPPGMGGEQYTSDEIVKGARTHGNKTAEAEAAALALSAKRGGAPLEGLGGKSLGFDATEGAGVSELPNAVPIPASEVAVGNEYRIQLSGAVVAAKAHLEAAQAHAKDVQGAGAANDEMGIGAADAAADVASAQKELMSAEQAQAFATQVSAAVAAALSSGSLTMRVAVVEDQTKKPPPTRAGQPQMDSDSQ